MRRVVMFVLFGGLVLLGGVFAMVSVVSAQTCKTEDECKNQIQEYESKLSGLQEQKSTLASQVQFFDTQIYLTGLRVQETQQKMERLENEVEKLGGKIEGLDNSLDYVSRLLIKKIAEDYKRRDVPLLSLLIDPDRASQLINRMKYAKVAQENDRKLAFQVQQAKLNFEQQKEAREEKAKELEELDAVLVGQKESLDGQKAVKQRLLADTQNDEAKYQSLLAQARAEFAAIQGIVSGGGTETLMREVKKGDTIASVISTASCNSSAAHLHFIVQSGGDTVNPFGYLSGIDHNNCSGSSCGASDGDAFNPSGSWSWPIPGPINFNQGYGETWAVRNSWVGNIYSFHNGIDVVGSSHAVTAVEDGELYSGSYALGCTLSYVKLKHKDSDLSTLYLHVYPQ